MEGQVLAAFGSASASSVYPSGAFGAIEATKTGSGYWCSAGSHAPGQRVTWIGEMSTAQKASGVTLQWAYGPGEYRVLTSSDGGNFEEAVGWRSPARSEVAFSETVMFQAPRHVKAVAVVMRSPKPWGYFGISGIAVLVEPGASMLLSKVQGEGDHCLVAAEDGLKVSKCLDAIATGLGGEVFTLSSRSQLVSAAGKCVTMDQDRVGLQDCEASLEAGDGRSSFLVTPEGQLRCQAVGNYCLSARGGGVAAATCTPAGEGGDFILAAVPEVDPAAAARARDIATLLKAAVARQNSLLQGLKAKAAACGSFLQTNSSASQTLASLAALSHSLRYGVMDPALDIGLAIDRGLNIDLASVKTLVAESRAILTSMQA